MLIVPEQQMLMINSKCTIKAYQMQSMYENSGSDPRIKCGCGYSDRECLPARYDFTGEAEIAACDGTIIKTR